jgi:hypothetical protein
MSNYLESCNNECKILMLIVIAVLCVLLYQYYQKYILCATKEGFRRKLVNPGANQRRLTYR